MNQKIINIDDNSFNNKVLLSKKCVLVIFWSDLCSPCKLLISLLKDIYKNYINKIIFFKLNINKSNIIIKKYNISSIPTIMLFNKGVLLSTKIGLLSKNKLINFLNLYI